MNVILAQLRGFSIGAGGLEVDELGASPWTGVRRSVLQPVGEGRLGHTHQVLEALLRMLRFRQELQ
jgi:hypothetical protein